MSEAETRVTGGRAAVHSDEIQPTEWISANMNKHNDNSKRRMLNQEPTFCLPAGFPPAQVGAGRIWKSHDVVLQE